MGIVHRAIKIGICQSRIQHTILPVSKGTDQSWISSLHLGGFHLLKEPGEAEIAADRILFTGSPFCFPSPTSAASGRKAPPFRRFCRLEPPPPIGYPHLTRKHRCCFIAPERSPSRHARRIKSVSSGEKSARQRPPPCRSFRAGNQRRGLTFAAIRSGSFFPKTNTPAPVQGPVPRKDTPGSHLNKIIRRIQAHRVADRIDLRFPRKNLTMVFSSPASRASSASDSPYPTRLAV